MLSYLRIKNLAIIHLVEVEFASGLNLLTGETGAGKSIIVDSLGLLLGGKASADLVRSGEQSGSVEGIFDIADNEYVKNKLRELNLDEEDKEIIIRRDIRASGKSQAYVNNHLVSLKDLRTIGQKLVDIHGQHEHQELIYSSNHLDLLDNFASNEVPRKRLKENYQHIRDILHYLEAARMGERDKSQRIDLLSFQINEIDQTKLIPGEDKKLEEEKLLLANAEKLHQLSIEGLQLIQGKENSILQQFNQLLKGLKGLAEIDQKFRPFQQNLEESRYQLEDLAAFLRDYQQKIAFDPQRLTQIEERLLEIKRLKKKYGDSIEDILAYRDKANQELNLISLDEEKEKRLLDELNNEYSQYVVQAEELSIKRKADARALENKMMKELKEVAMEKARFAVEFSPQPALNPQENVAEIKVVVREKGIDKIEFFISPNVGEELKPLAKIASGGEISRIMLALKTAGSAKEVFKTLIFDEIDIGIGGGTAEVIGRKLKILSLNQQIICVTHLPQIAAFAQHHYLVEKKVRQKRTKTTIIKLKVADRIEEIARMLGGVTITDTTKQHARELLQQSSTQLADL